MNTRRIVIQYPPMSGGKFIAHCLSMSPHVIPIGQYPLIERFVFSECVRSRMEYVLSTFPPDQSQLKNWRRFEAKRYTPDWNIPAAGVDSNKFYFFITHCAINANEFDHVISLTNSAKFRALSTLIGKHLGWLDFYNQIKCAGWPNYPCFPSDIPDHVLDVVAEKVGFQLDCQGNMLLDVDSTIFNKTDFLCRIETFANKIGIEDLDMTAVEQVYDTYISLHQ